MIEQIIHIDRLIFEWINTGIANSFFDLILPPIRNKYFWVPAYIALIIWAIVKHKKQGAIWVVFLIITISLSDQISASIIKPIFHRLRPCHSQHLFEDFVLRVHCGRGFSFVSAHACNHTALATFLILSLKWLQPKWKYLLIIWAASISIAQVYVGVHYPIDILTGAFIGFFIAYCLHLLFKRYFSLQ